MSSVIPATTWLQTKVVSCSASSYGYRSSSEKSWSASHTDMFPGGEWESRKKDSEREDDCSMRLQASTSARYTCIYWSIAWERSHTIRVARRSGAPPGNSSMNALPRQGLDDGYLQNKIWLQDRSFPKRAIMFGFKAH